MENFIFIAIDCADKAKAQHKRGKKPTHAYIRHNFQAYYLESWNLIIIHLNKWRQRSGKKRIGRKKRQAPVICIKNYCVVRNLEMINSR